MAGDGTRPRPPVQTHALGRRPSESAVPRELRVGAIVNFTSDLRRCQPSPGLVDWVPATRHLGFGTARAFGLQLLQDPFQVRVEDLLQLRKVFQHPGTDLFQLLRRVVYGAVSSYTYVGGLAILPFPEPLSFGFKVTSICFRC